MTHSSRQDIFKTVGVNSESTHIWLPWPIGTKVCGQNYKKSIMHIWSSLNIVARGGSIIINPIDINGCPSQSFIIESDVKPDSRKNVTCNPIFISSGIELVELLYDYWFTLCCPAAVITHVSFKRRRFASFFSFRTKRIKTTREVAEQRDPANLLHWPNYICQSIQTKLITQETNPVYWAYTHCLTTGALDSYLYNLHFDHIVFWKENIFFIFLNFL